MSASRRPTGTTRGVCGTSSTTVLRPCGSFAVVTTPAGLCSRTYASGCAATRFPSTSTTSRDPTTVLSSPRTPLTETRPADDQLVGPPPRRDAGAGEERVQPHRRFHLARLRDSRERIRASGFVCASADAVSQIEAWMDKLAELAVFGANVQEGQLVAVTSFVGKEEVAREDRPRGVPARREVRRRGDVRPVGQARADRPRRRGDARLRATVDVAAAPAPLRRARRADHALGPARSACAGGPRSRPSRAGPAPVPARDRRGGQPADDELDDRPGADARLGRRSCIRTSTPTRRSAGCGRRSRTSAASMPRIRGTRGSSEPRP